LTDKYTVFINAQSKDELLQEQVHIPDALHNSPVVGTGSVREHKFARLSELKMPTRSVGRKTVFLTAAMINMYSKSSLYKAEINLCVGSCCCFY
jgi:hypothetical protein